jgi:hypothetical protein
VLGVYRMEKGQRLFNKVKHLLRRIGAPRWLHRRGPKKYELLHHVHALLVRAFCRASYRRTKKLLDLLGVVCPSKSALQYTAARLAAGFWDRILKITCPNSYLVALDATCFSRSNPSYHYLRRIDGKIPKVPVKLNAAFDTKRKKFVAAKVRVRPAHDLRDAGALLRRSKPRIAVADKGYTSELLHRLADEQGTLLMVPLKKNIRRGRYRKKHQAKFRTRTYHRREIVEASFSSIKRKMGGSISSKKVRTIRTEVLGRLACHNITGRKNRDLGQSRQVYAFCPRYIFHSENISVPDTFYRKHYK